MDRGAANDLGGNVHVSGGVSEMGVGGDFQLTSGYGVAQTSGMIGVAIAHAGVSGVSGMIDVSTGSSTGGASGKIQVTTGTPVKWCWWWHCFCCWYRKQWWQWSSGGNIAVEGGMGSNIESLDGGMGGDIRGNCLPVLFIFTPRLLSDYSSELHVMLPLIEGSKSIDVIIIASYTVNYL